MSHEQREPSPQITTGMLDTTPHEQQEPSPQITTGKFMHSFVRLDYSNIIGQLECAHALNSAKV